MAREDSTNHIQFVVVVTHEYRLEDQHTATILKWIMISINQQETKRFFVRESLFLSFDSNHIILTNNNYTIRTKWSPAMKSTKCRFDVCFVFGRFWVWTFINTRHFDVSSFFYKLFIQRNYLITQLKSLVWNIVMSFFSQIDEIPRIFEIFCANFTFQLRFIRHHFPFFVDRFFQQHILTLIQCLWDFD